MSLLNVENNMFTLSTPQIDALKKLSTALKDILIETNLEITPQGIKILNMDKSQNIVVYMNLYSHKFDFYECKKDKIIIGIVMKQFFELINGIESTDALTIYIENKDYYDGIVNFLTIEYYNSKEKETEKVKLKIIEPENEKFDWPDVCYETRILMPASRFQKVIKKTQKIGDKLEITSINNYLKFNCVGVFANYELICEGLNFNEVSSVEDYDESKIITGNFNLKYLSYFIKCTTLCNTIKLYLENDLPLMVEYNVGTLGDIKLCLAHIPGNNEI